MSVVYIYVYILYIYIFLLLLLLFTSSYSCCKDQFVVSYFSTSFIVLIQVYNWEIRHHSLVCCCGLADILYTVDNPVALKDNQLTLTS